MSRIDEFRAANPQYDILSATDSVFNDYGVIYPDYDLSEINQVMNQVKTPDEGSKYLISIDSLEKTDTIKQIRNDVFAGMPIEAGATIGHTDDFTAFEYHQSSELNIMLDDVIMVLGKRQTLERQGSIDPNREAKMFYVPKGSVVELFNDTLHYAPIQVAKSGYKVIVVVVKGTNEVLPDSFKKKNPRVVKQGKFQVVHACRKDKIAQGYQVALIGDVIKTHPLNS